MIKKTIILTDERCGGTSLLHIVNSLYTEEYSGLDDIHSSYYILKNNHDHWIKSVFNNSRRNMMKEKYDNNDNILSEFMNKFENIEELEKNYFELINFLFCNGINTYKLSITSINNELYFDMFINNLKNNIDNINIILLNRKNIYKKIYSKLYAISYLNKFKCDKGFDTMDNVCEIIADDEIIKNVINSQIVFEKRMQNIKDLNLTTIDVVYEDLFYNINYFRDFLVFFFLSSNFSNETTLESHIKNFKLFVISYFKNYKSENKIILNEYLLKNEFEKQYNM